MSQLILGFQPEASTSHDGLQTSPFGSEVASGHKLRTQRSLLSELLTQQCSNEGGNDAQTGPLSDTDDDDDDDESLLGASELEEGAELEDGKAPVLPPSSPISIGWGPSQAHQKQKENYQRLMHARKVDALLLQQQQAQQQAAQQQLVARQQRALLLQQQQQYAQARAQAQHAGAVPVH